MQFTRLALIVCASALALGLGSWLSLKTVSAPSALKDDNRANLTDNQRNKARFDAFYQKKLVQHGAEKPASVAMFVAPRFTVINLWATWCTPCREEMPEFVAFRNAYGSERGVEFVGIAIDRADPVARFVNEIKVNYPMLFDDISAIEITKSFGNEKMALPFSYVVNAKGEIVKTKLGKLTTDELLAITSK